MGAPKVGPAVRLGLIDRLGFTALSGPTGWGWFNTLNASARNCRLFVSVILNDLARLVSTRQIGSPRRTFWPKFPRRPGRGFCRTITPEFPLPSLRGTEPAVPAGTILATACNMHRFAAPVCNPFRFCKEVTVPHCGSWTFVHLAGSK